MNIDPRFEIGVDYEGVSPRHLQVGEVHEFDNETSTRIFMPSMGSYYVDSMKIIDHSTGVELVRGVDYKAFILDEVATERSGKEACGIIEVIDPECSGVIIDYQYVGGLHISGYYILKQLVQMYPNGVSAIIEWNDVLNKPDLYDASYHTHHVREIINSKDLVVMIERIRSTIVTNKNTGLTTLYNTAQDKIDKLYSEFEDNLRELRSSFDQVLNGLKIQGREVIMTDNPENPAIKRKYGQWELLTNSILHAANSLYVTGSGFMIDMNTEQIIRNVYIWKNIEGVATKPKITVTADKEIINEGDEITFTITLNDVEASSSLSWIIRNADDLDISGGMSGVSAGGSLVRTVTVKFAKDRRTDGDRKYTFQITNFPNAFVHFTVMDTSKLKVLNLVAFKDGNILNEVSENEEFRVLLWGPSYSGQEVHLSYQGLDPDEIEFESDVVEVYTFPSGPSVKIKGNGRVDPERFLVISARDAGDTDIAASTKLFIHDSSQFVNVSVAFLMNNTVVTSIDEGSNFQIRLRTDSQPGTLLDLEYESNKDLSEFDGLVNSVEVGLDGSAYIPVTLIPNNATATEQEYLTVKVLSSGTVVSSQRVDIVDTSKNVDYNMYFASDVDGNNPITSINEGSDFFLIIKIPTWNDRSRLNNDFDYSFNDQNTTMAQLRERLDGYFPPQLAFGESNVSEVSWSNGYIQSRRFTTIANEKVDTDQNFVVKVKPDTMTGWSKTTSITIVDTSTGKITASPLDLNGNPIPNLKESTTDNKNFKGYIEILSVDPIQNYNRLDVDIPDEYRGDFKTQFPIRIDTTGHTYRIPVEVRLDNKTEGLESIPFNIIYTTTSGVKVTQTSFIDVEDTSTHTPLRLALGYMEDGVVDGKFSQWVPIRLVAGSFIYNDPSEISYRITYIDGRDASSRFDVTELVQPFPVGTTYAHWLMSPKIMNADVTDNKFRVSAVRLIDGIEVTEVSTIDFELRNDGHPETIKMEIYTDEARTQLAPESIDEGKTYYGKVIITNARKDGVVIVNNPFAVETQRTGNSLFTGRNQNHIIDNFSMKVLSKVRKATLSGDQEFKFTFTAVNDRETNPHAGGRWLRLTAFVDKDFTGAIGSNYPNATAPVNSLVSPNKDMRINDLSKTVNYEVSFTDINGTVKASFDEGETMIVKLIVKQGTIGDGISIQPAAGGSVVENRFGYNEFNEPKVITNSVEQILEYRLDILENYTTDIGNGLLYIAVVNEQVGSTSLYPSWNIRINDTSNSTTITGGWYREGAVNVISSIDEGVESYLRVYTDIKRANDVFKIEVLSGRPETELEINELNTIKAINDSRYADFRFKFKRNKTDDTLNILRVKVTYIYNSNQLGSRDFQISINDVSRELKILEGVWSTSSSNDINTVKGAEVSSIDEGRLVFLHVVTDGGNESYDLRLDNDGGRDAGRITTAVYGTTRTRNNNNSTIAWAITPSKDGITNSGNNTKLKVKVQSVSDPSKFAVYELPINDVSTDTTAEIRLLDDTTNEPITSIDEGKFFKADFKVNHPKPGITYTYRVRSSHEIVESSGWSSSVQGTRSQTWTTPSNGAEQATHVGRIKYTEDNLTNPTEQLEAFVEVLEGATVIASTNLRINDTSKTPTIVKVDISTSESAITNTPDGYFNEGGNYFIHVTLENYRHSSFKLKYDGPNTSGSIKMVPDQYLERIGQTTPNLATQTLVFEFNPALDEDTVPSGSDTPSAYFRVYDPNDVEIGSTIFVLRNTSPLPQITSVFWASSSGSNTPITEAYEGQVIYLVVLTKGIHPETPITVDLRDSGVDLDDFSGLDSLVKMINVTSYNEETTVGRATLRLVTLRDNVIG